MWPPTGLDTPFLLLPFRPSSDPSAARAFVRNYFNNSFKNGSPIQGDELMQELRLTDPMVRPLCHPCVVEPLLTVTGPLQCAEMVLEQTPRRSCYLGSL